MEHEPEEPPPFLGTWGKVYGAVVVYTAALIGLLYWMTTHLNR